MILFLINFKLLFFCYFLSVIFITKADDIVGCGGFVKSNIEIKFELIKVKLYTNQGILKYESDCAPTNGYYMVPVYDKGEYYLKVEAPLGWTFDPDTVKLNIDWKTDKCSLEEDINFVFSGFGIAGKVISFGQIIGPKGVILSLKNLETDKEVSKTVTMTDGVFSFEKILPGRYLIKASHSVWKFKNSESIVIVDKKAGNIESEIVVSGYDTTGKILSEGQPVQGVHFLLYSKTISQEPIENCDSKDLIDAPQFDNLKYLCFVSSTNAGIFMFPVLKTGEYTLIPMYRNERIKYDVSPNKIDFNIEHDSFIIKDVFQVSGFVVSGKVLISPKGVGLEGASIILNGSPVGISNAKGVYHLDSMKSGTYKIKVAKEGYVFNNIEVKINPADPLLPDIYPIKYKICGKIILEEIPENSSNNLQFIIIFETRDGRVVSRVSSKSDKSFCELLGPQEYIIKVETEDKVSRIHLLPSARQIIVIDKPINDVIFTQMQAKISGTIECIVKCGSLTLFLKSLDDANDSGKKIQLSSEEKVIKFTQDVFVGNYILNILDEKWCWEKDNVNIQISDENIIKVNFKQSGFKMNAVMSHEAILEIKETESNIKSVQYKVGKNANAICLSSNKIYEITPKSCHKFEKEIYYYDTNSDKHLQINVISYLVKLEVSTNQNNSNLIATITDLDNSAEVIIDSFKLVSSSIEGKTMMYHHEAFHFTNYNSEISIHLNSETLLFEPESKVIKISSDSCPAAILTFVGILGIFIEGIVKPPIYDVEITLQIFENDKFRTTFTNANGQYKIGPFKSDIEYSLMASKLGYRFVEDPNKKNNFIAYKLAEILVEVSNVDSEGEKLPGVLISLSGAKFRRNNLTSEMGVISFMDLTPGQYFLKPMMKEYDFQPSTQVLEISEGQVLNVKIEAKRVAFSAICLVTSLNGEAEPGLVIEAKGVGPSQICTQLQEEAKTELDGSVRIRGLKPGCEYEILLKNNSDFDAIFERSAPSSRKIQISESDVFGIRFIVFRKFTHMDLSGRIDSRQEYLDTIKIQLFLDTNPDDAIQAQSISVSPFFYFNSIPIDKQSYTIKMTSTLSRRDYEYILEEIHFKSDSTVQHFVLHFNPQRKQSGDHELNQASIFMLISTIGVLFLCYNYKMIIPIARKTFNDYISTKPTLFMRTSLTPPRQTTPELGLPLELLDTVGKRRKKLTKI